MTCSVKCPDKNAGLIVESWSGDSFKTLQCTIDDNIESQHFVEIENIKTYNRTIYVKGIIASNQNAAKFDGPSTLNEKEWEESNIVHHHNPRTNTHIRKFGGVRMIKKTVGKKIFGRDSIEVNVRYEDEWNPGNIMSANTSNVVFSIDVN